MLRITQSYAFSLENLRWKTYGRSNSSSYDRIQRRHKSDASKATGDPATLLLVDDHPLLRKGLAQLVDLDDSLTVVAETDNGKEALAWLSSTIPILILLDLNMQGMDGLETLKAMREAQVSARIIILTVSDNDEDVVCAITYGADGYLLKDMDPEDILKKIKEAAVGKMVVSEKVTHILAGAIRKGDNNRTSMLAKLTSREHDILKQISKGLSNKLIARELGISDGTVKVHVKHILKKTRAALKSRSRGMDD